MALCDDVEKEESESFDGISLRQTIIQEIDKKYQCPGPISRDSDYDDLG